MHAPVLRLLATLFASAILTAPASAQNLRILPMGDSITFGSGGTANLGGYRGPLYDLLVNSGHAVDYLGTSTGNSALLADMDHEGHSGWRIDQLDSNVAGWFNAIDDPDIILLHIGTNDFGQGVDTPNAINRLDALITQMAGLRPNAHIIVTNLMERGEPQNSAIQTQFNPFVEGVVDDQIAAGNRVSFLDMRAAVPLSDMPDNLHPNQTGYEKMAAAWLPAIEASLDPGDAVPPSIVRARGTESGDLVLVTFNKSLDETSAETVGNYSISGGISILDAELSPSGRLVTLTTSPQSLGTTYTLTVNNVTDEVLPAPNTIAADSTAQFFAATPAGYFNNIGEANCYSLVYSLNIPDSANYGNGIPIPYDIDHRNLVGPTFDRIAYYMELQTPGGDLRYAWASMDAFTTSLDEIGVPNLTSFQQPVTDLNVTSNVPGVTNSQGLVGNIEFWPTNYNPDNDASVPGASDAVHDLGDRDAGSGGYGSMQIHNTSGAQSVMAYNRWGGGSGGPSDIGIGNNTGTHPDWTFEQNSTGFTVKKIQILVRTLNDHTAPTLASAGANFGGSRITVRFSEPVRRETLVAENFSLDNGVSILGVTTGDDLHEAILETTTHPEAPLTLTARNLRDTSHNANLTSPASIIAVTPPQLPAEVVANIGAASDGYELLYSIDIPATGNFNAVDPYRVDNSSAIGPFSRVAYYLELQTADNPIEYIWTSMDAFTTDPEHLGVPTAGSGAFFQTTVTDLEVLSNQVGIVTGSGIATGNIEFWPSNYNGTNPISIPGASAENFDFGDGNASSATGYGSMQIHNYGAAQTLFALNRFGVDGNPLCLGIGNRPGETNSDWTFANNAGNYSRRVMHIMVLPAAAPVIPADVLANVPESSSYELVYSLDIPAIGNLSGGAGFAPYDIDQSSGSGSFSRVAYYLELQMTGDAQPTFVWVSMDAFTANRKQIGVPNLASGAVWQQLATNLNVVSNSGAITTGSGLSGNLEFWPSNYNGTNSLPVPGAGGVFDFGDNPIPGGYGSMQVHNYVAGETLFAINRWGSTGNTDIPLCVGIGNNPAPVNNGIDWTFADNAPTFDLRRRLHVFVLSGPSPFGGPEIERIVPSTTLDRLVVAFDREVSDSSAVPSNFSIDSGITVTGATLLSNKHDIALTTSIQTGGTTYNVTASGVRDRSPSGIIQPGVTASFVAYTPPAALANVPDADFELIYQLEIPASHPQWNLNPISYSIDESRYGERPVDRVAYMMEIDGDWIYASFDPHTNQISQIGVPTLQVSPTPFQQIVTDMNVASNVPGIITGNGIATGNIEFWGGNYQEANGISIPSADASTYDFGDNMTGGDYGSMQIHNHGASQTLFAYNNWGGNSGGFSDTGIGNNDSGTGDPDWTFSASSQNSASRTLYVLARPGGTPSGEAPEILTHPCNHEVAAGADTTFAVNVLGDGPFTYQWRCNGIVIPRETLPWLTLTSVTSADVASYDVVVTGQNLVQVTSLPGLLSLIGTPPTPIELWRIASGLHPGEADLEDRDDDRLLNLLEFGFGTDPNLSDNAPLTIDGSTLGTPIIIAQPGGGGFDAVFVRRNDHGQPGSLSYSVQFSSDLATFHDSVTPPVFVASSSQNPTYEIVSVPFPPLTPDGHEVHFYRVKIELVR